MKTFILALLAFLLGFSTVLGYQYLQSQETNSPVAAQPKTESAPQPTFALVPPSESVSGVLTVTGGHAEKLSRDETDYKEASTGAQILTGESVATKEQSTATATVSGIVSVNMGPGSELVFANLFPSDFVLQQKAGKIDYLVQRPISDRALHALVSIPSGETSITIINTDMSVTAITGSVTFALVDSENNTRVWNLSAGQRANIDDWYRQVYLVQP